MNSSSRNSGGVRGTQQQEAGRGGGDPGPFVVRVLYNKEAVALVELPNGGAGHVVEYCHFKDQVLAPFMLSQQDHEQACHVGVSHEGPLPTIMSMSSASGKEEE